MWRRGARARSTRTPVSRCSTSTAGGWQRNGLPSLQRRALNAPATSRWQDYATLHNCLAAHKLDTQVAIPPPQAPTNSQLDVTLEKLRQLQRPAVRSPLPRGFPEGVLKQSNSTLTAAQRGAIGDHVRRCWSTDPGMPDLDKMEVLLTVTTDSSGVARLAAVAQDDVGRVSDNRPLRVFAERAIRAVVDPNCSNLPLPSSMLGWSVSMSFRFRH